MELLPHDLRIPNCCLPVQMQQLFEAMDANHDGVLSREEFEQAPDAGPWSWGNNLVIMDLQWLIMVDNG